MSTSSSAVSDPSSSAGDSSAEASSGYSSDSGYSDSNYSSSDVYSSVGSTEGSGGSDSLGAKKAPHPFTPRQQNIVTALVGLCGVLVPFATSVYLPAFDDIVEDLNTTDGTLTYSVSLFVIINAILPLFVGPLSDRFGRRYPLLLSLLIYSVTVLIMGFSKSVELFIAMRCLQAFGSSSLLVIGFGAVSDAVEGSRKGQAMGIISVAILVGPVAAPLVGAGMSEWLGWRAIFFFMAILVFLITLICIPLFPETLDPNSPKKFPTPLVTLAQLTNIKVLISGLVVGLGHGAIYFLILLFSIYLKREYGLTRTEVALSIASFAVGGIPGALGGGSIVDRAGFKGVMLFASGLQPIPVLLIGWLLETSIIPVLIASVVYGILNSMNRTAVQTLHVVLVPEAASSVSAAARVLQLGSAALVSFTVVPLVDSIGAGWTGVVYVAPLVVFTIAQVPIILKIKASVPERRR